ncbi:MAG TPA: hypothetical protein VF244_11035 [Acidimicrobiales bacterium]
MSRKRKDEMPDDSGDLDASLNAQNFRASMDPALMFTVLDYNMMKLGLPVGPPPAATPAPLPVEASTHLIVGYREWKLLRRYPDGCHLKSVNNDEVVQPYQRIEATCRPLGGVITFSFNTFGSALSSSRTPQPVPHPAPAHSCTCGIYAYRDGVDIREDRADPYVLGEVNLWGRVIEHESGYRAQFAYPKRLALVNGGDRAEHIAADLELTYGVPCEVWA